VIGQSRPKTGDNVGGYEVQKAAVEPETEARRRAVINGAQRGASPSGGDYVIGIQSVHALSKEPII